MAKGRAVRAGKAFVELFTDNNPLSRGLRAAERKVRAFGQKIGEVGQKLVRLGAMAALPLAASTRVFAGFEDQMAEAGAVTQATEGQLQSMTQTAKELGRTTSFTAAQVAAGMTELGRAGFRPQEVNNAIRPVLNLARATRTELADAAMIASATMRGFNLTTEDTGRIADVLTKAANSSATTLVDLGEGMKYVAPLASEVGDSLEDTAAAMGVLADNGIRGTMAGTQLARAYKNVPKKLSALETVGVQAADAEGNLRPMVEILQELGEVTRRMGTAARLRIFEEIFGRGSVGGLKLAAGGARFDGLTKGLREAQGTAQKTAKAMDDTVGGSFRMMLSAIEGIAIAIGDALKKPMREFAGWLRDGSEQMARWLEASPGVVLTVAKLTAGALAGGVALIALGKALGLVAAGLGAVKVAMSVLLSPIAIVTAAIAGLSVVALEATGEMSDSLRWLGDRWGRLKDAASAAMDGMVAALGRGDVAAAVKVLWASIKLAWVKGTQWLSGIWYKFSTSWKRGTVDVVMSIVKWWYRAAGDFAVAWAESVATVKTIWFDLMNWLAKKTISVAGTVTKFMIRVKGIATGKSAQQIYHELNAVDKIVKIKKRALEDEHKQRLAQIDEEEKKGIARAVKDCDRRLAMLDKVTKAEEATRKAEDTAEVERAKNRLTAAENALAAAIAAANGATSPKFRGAKGPKKPPTIADVMKAVQTGMKTVDHMMGRSAGTFNARALWSLGGSTEQERIAASTAETAKAAGITAKNTRRLVRKFDGVLCFS